MASVLENNPLGDAYEQSLKASNHRLISQTVAEGLGLPNAAEHTSLSIQQLADAEQVSASMFEAVKSELPAVGASDFARKMEGLSQKKGPAGRSMGQKLVNDAIEEARKSGGVYDGEEMMQTRGEWSARMADLYAKGDTSSGKMMRDAIAKLDELIEQTAKKRGGKETVEKWRRARSQWQLLQMVKKPGVISNTEDVNPVALMRAMKRDKDVGGFGLDGPERGTPARKLWEIARVAAGDESHVPATGLRGVIANQLKQGIVGKGLVGGAAASAGFGGLGLLD